MSIRNRPLNVIHELVPTVLYRAVRALAFWTAVVLPFVQLAFLGGVLEFPGSYATFALLVVVNGLAAVLGHHHDVGHDRR